MWSLGALLVIVGLQVLSVSCEKHHQTIQDKDSRRLTDRDLMTDVHEGWQTAGRLLGLDMSQGAASLLAASLASAGASDKQDSLHPSQSQTLFHGFFRLLGFDTSKLNAIAVNAVVFIAKMIGSSLIRNFTGAGTERSQEEPEGSPLFWILDDVKTQARSLLSQAQDGHLSDQLISSLQAVPGDTDCIQLLVCRASPLLTGMQRSLQQLLSNSSAPQHSSLDTMYQYLPDKQEFVNVAGTCGKRLPSCNQLFAAFDE